MKKEYVVGIIVLVLVGLSLATLFSSERQSSKTNTMRYIEITNPTDYVNTGGEPIRIADYIGKKVVLLDIMTYSCINCQRTFPYINGWYEMYRDDGLLVIGIHTPEFAFEKDKGNVEEAMKRFGIKHPVVMDNDYGTWNAYGNRYWPRKYLIDIHGDVVYDHIGEGGYEETEGKIRELLKERAQVLGEEVNLDDDLASLNIEETKILAQSPETYFGSLRNSLLANGPAGFSGEETFGLPGTIRGNALYLAGDWSLEPEYASSIRDSKIVYRYKAKEVFIVADADEAMEVEVWQDGKKIDNASGVDVSDGVVTIEESRLYKLINNPGPEEHVLELRINGQGVRFYAFTFG